MPLTNVYISNPSPLMWFLVRLVLALVAIGAVALVWAIYTSRGQSPGLSLWLALGGSVYFAFHTGILDAIVWAALFK